jgi:hypothetical protein
MEATLTHQVMDERRECGEPHTRALARLAWPGRRAHDMRVNGPPKSGPSPCGGAATFFRFWFPDGTELRDFSAIFFRKSER